MVCICVMQTTISQQRTVAQAQENAAHNTITALKEEMDELTALVEAGPAAEEEAMLASLLKEKDQLLRERETQVGPHALGWEIMDLQAAAAASS